jgi:hypothetical protein
VYKYISNTNRDTLRKNKINRKDKKLLIGMFMYAIWKKSVSSEASDSIMTWVKLPPLGY